MKISIITATFNSGRTVADTLESVLAQDYSDYELIVKDGGSRDNTLDICRSYDARFEGRLRIISAPDRGLYDAMPQAIAPAPGDVDLGVSTTCESAGWLDHQRGGCFDFRSSRRARKPPFTL